MKRFFQPKNIHLLFIVSVILKGFNAAVEIIGGIIVAIVSQSFIIKIVLFLTQEELLEDPSDKIANYLINSAQYFSLSAKHFIAFYLLSHGIIKLALVIGLLKNKLWSYPVSIVVFGIFIIYQIYRYYFTHSLWLLILTAFDLIVVWLVWHEYKYLRIKKEKKSSYIS